MNILITLASNDETPWWWSEKIETCRSDFKCFKWKLYRCICWLIVEVTYIYNSYFDFILKKYNLFTDMLPQHLAYKNELNREYVNFSKERRNSLMMIRKDRTCRSDFKCFKWKLYSCTCWLVVKIISSFIYALDQLRLLHLLRLHQIQQNCPLRRQWTMRAAHHTVKVAATAEWAEPSSFPHDAACWEES